MIGVSRRLGCNRKIFKKHFLELPYNLVFKNMYHNSELSIFFRNPFMATVVYIIQYLNFLDSIGDVGSGVILLVLSLVMLCGCLIGLVKLLNSMLDEKVKNIIFYVNKAQSAWFIIRNRVQKMIKWTWAPGKIHEPLHYLSGSFLKFHDLIWRVKSSLNNAIALTVFRNHCTMSERVSLC